MPEAVMKKLLQKLECATHEAVPFDVFKSGIFTCCVLQGNFNCLAPCNTLFFSQKMYIFHISSGIYTVKLRY